jgi:hypothetical protein
MVSLEFLDYEDGIPFSDFIKSKSKSKKRGKKSKKRGKRVKRGKSKRGKSKRVKSKRVKSKRVKSKSKKKPTFKVPPSGVIIRKNDRLFKSDGKNLKLIE